MRNVLEYLEDSAGRMPDKTAVADENRRYTFGELAAAAQSIGFMLSESGHRNEAVGVISERCAASIACFFGVLYSGNYYVPLDPDMPLSKKQSVIDETGMKVILSPEKTSDTEDLPKYMEGLGFDGELYYADEAMPHGCPMPDTAEDDPLYLIYTSGSTGKPKGILKSHRAVISFVEAFSGDFDLKESDVLGNQTPFCFDASAKDIYLMLRLACTMEIIPTRMFTFPTELIEYLNERKVSVIFWVPSALSIVVQLNTFSLIRPEYLRMVFFVGEVMPLRYLNKWVSALPDVRYINLYGQSELAGVCCRYEVKAVSDESGSLPIGWPLSNCTVCLYDGSDIISEPDTKGEIIIASDALALMYYNDPEKTEKSFFMHDFGDGVKRWFRTGDIAYYNEEGVLVFSSRQDSQIKHQGYRIELGEIESVAMGIEGLQRCCCIYHDEKKKIVLCCELAEGCEYSEREIRAKLKSMLNEYMVPKQVRIFDKLPLNANGKTDRQAVKSILGRK